MLKVLPGCTHCKVLGCSQGQLFLQKWQGGPRAAVRSDALLVPTAVATEGCIPLYQWAGAAVTMSTVLKHCTGLVV